MEVKDPFTIVLRGSGEHKKATIFRRNDGEAYSVPQSLQLVEDPVLPVKAFLGFVLLFSVFSHKYLGLIDIRSLEKDLIVDDEMSNLWCKVKAIHHYLSGEYFFIPLSNQLEKMGHLSGQRTVRAEEIPQGRYSTLEVDPDVVVTSKWMEDWESVLKKFPSVDIIFTGPTLRAVLHMESQWQDHFKVSIIDVKSSKMRMPKIFQLIQMPVRAKYIIHLEYSLDAAGSWVELKKFQDASEDENDESDDSCGGESPACSDIRKPARRSTKRKISDIDSTRHTRRSIARDSGNDSVETESLRDSGNDSVETESLRDSGNDSVETESLRDSGNDSELPITVLVLGMWSSPVHENTHSNPRFGQWWRDSARLKELSQSGYRRIHTVDHKHQANTNQGCITDTLHFVSLSAVDFIHFSVDCGNTGHFFSTLFAHHQEHFFQHYKEIYLDYNFSPGENYQETWKNFLNQTIPLIGATNLLCDGGVIMLPSWSVVSEAIENRDLKEWFETTEVDQEANSLFLASSSLREKDQRFDKFADPLNKRFFQLKLRKSNSRSDAIQVLDQTIKVHHRPAGVKEGFKKLMGQSSATPVTLLDEENAGPLIGYYRRLQECKQDHVFLKLSLERNGKMSLIEDRSINR
jgi:hypothetical protein